QGWAHLRGPDGPRHRPGGPRVAVPLRGGLVPGNQRGAGRRGRVPGAGGCGRRPGPGAAERAGVPHPEQPAARRRLVHGARKRVVLTTPYFIPDEPLLQAMQTAVLRGVEVHLVVSEAGDHPVVSLAQSSYYEELLEAGVQIHLYRTNFLHAKHVSID